MTKATGAEQRRHRRYDLAMPLQVKSGLPTSTPILTTTQDISAEGIYFTLSEGVELGSALELELELPPQLTGGKKVRIRCRGRIVRVDNPEAKGSTGIAATIEEYEFLRNF